MKHARLVIAALAAVMAVSGPALAQPGRHDDHHSGPGPGGPPHHDWRKGGRSSPGDWNRGQQVDWHSHHLRRPPRGYEWRQVDGNYVLAAAATGLILGLALSH